MGYMSIGPAPCEEYCAQVGNPDYEQKAMRECKRFRAMLERRFPPPEGVVFEIKACPHDFGTYYDVGVTFDEENEAALDFALHVESNTPRYWNE